MSIKFPGAITDYASTQGYSRYLTASGYPSSVGAWVNPLSTAAVQAIASIVNTGTSAVWIGINQLGRPQITSRAASTDTTTTINTSVNTGVWTFILGRFITTTNRRLSVLYNNGNLLHNQSTTSSSPSTLATMGIGATPFSTVTNPFNGYIAEMFWCHGDIVGSDIATPTDMMNAIAYGGPFAVRPDLVAEYLSMRSYSPPFPIGAPIDEIYTKGQATQQISLWALFGTGSNTAAPHPPLPYWRAKPQESFRTVMF